VSTPMRGQGFALTYRQSSEWPTIPQVYVKGEFVGGCDIIMSSESKSQPQTELYQSSVNSASEWRVREIAGQGGFS
jgi:monothiol glutaredoxin